MLLHSRAIVLIWLHNRNVFIHGFTVRRERLIQREKQNQRQTKQRQLQITLMHQILIFFLRPTAVPGPIHVHAHLWVSVCLSNSKQAVNVGPLVSHFYLLFILNPIQINLCATKKPEASSLRWPQWTLCNFLAKPILLEVFQGNAQKREHFTSIFLTNIFLPTHGH